jgi:hypothetical protein
MGFLDQTDDTPKTPESKPAGGFLSDNPPPTPPSEAGGDELAWSEIPGKAASNFVRSGSEFASNLVHPFLHPQETIEGIGNVGHGLAQRLGVAPEGGHEDEKYWDALKESFKNRYGSIKNFKQTLAEDPVGFAGDLSMALTGGETAFARAPGLLGKVGKTAGIASKVVDPLTVPTTVGAGLINAGGKATAGAANIVAHTGVKPIEEAAKAGYEGGAANKAFKESMRDITTPEQIVDNARAGVDSIVKQKNLDYKQRKAMWGQSQQPLSWTDINQGIRDANDIQTFHGVDVLSPRGQAMRGKLNDIIHDWSTLPASPYHTAAGFDALKKKITNIGKDFDIGTPERLIADNYAKGIRETIKGAVPEYAQAMERYGAYSDLVKELRKTLSLPADASKGTIDTALRKLTSTQRKNVNTNFGQRARLIDELVANGAEHLIPQLAGQALKSTEAHGLARFIPAILAGGGHNLEALLSAVASPRAVGEAARFVGSLPRYTGLKYLPKKQIGRFAQQEGRWNQPYSGPNLGPLQPQSRGGAVERALRTAKRR